MMFKRLYVWSIISIVSILTASLLCDSVVALPEPLTARHVGQYAGKSWGAPDQTPARGSFLERTNPLAFTVRSINVNDDKNPEPDLTAYVQEVYDGLGHNPARTVLFRIHFWDGTDRYKLPIRDISVYKARLDWACGQIEPVMHLIHGISLSEENVPADGRTALLEELYWHVKKQYPDLPIYQWWSPNTSVPGTYEGIFLSADGWIFDPYTFCAQMYPDFKWHVGPDPYLRLVRKYVVTGVPLIPMQNASDDPGLCDWYDPNTSPYPTTMWKIVEHQRLVNKAFNLPTSYYWSHKGTCYFPAVTGEGLIDAISTDVIQHCRQMSHLPADWRGDPAIADVWHNTAVTLGDDGTVLYPFGSFKRRDKWGPDVYYEDRFSSSKFLDHSKGSGFRDLIFQGKDLRTRGFDGRDVDVAIIYHFVNPSLLRSPEILLKVNANPLLKGKAKVSASIDGVNWPVYVQSKHEFGVQNLILRTGQNPQFEGIKELHVKIELAGQADAWDNPAVCIDDFRITKPTAAKSKN